MLQQCFTMYTITRDSIPKQTAKFCLEVFNFRSTVLQIGENMHAALKQTTERKHNYFIYSTHRSLKWKRQLYLPSDNGM